VSAMSNKVTRRVALGSIAAGLGTVAVVVQSLKQKYRVELPSRNRVTHGPPSHLRAKGTIEGTITGTAQVTRNIVMPDGSIETTHKTVVFGPQKMTTIYVPVHDVEQR
jgi:hypothetical protein